MAESRVPLKARKQMLLMRAAVERVELAHRMLDLRRAATVSAIVRNAMPNDSSRGLATRVFDFIKRNPFATSAVSLVATRFKFPILKQATKWGGVATLGYKLYELWKEKQVKEGRRPPPITEVHRRH